MIQKDGVDVEMLPDDWKRTGHVIQACDFFAEKVFSCVEKKCAKQLRKTSEKCAKQVSESAEKCVKI